ncbi:MAG: ABC transporter ATP-binding protein [Verrucomicrobiae bacterium]|nr:ABC transporter ATP-binding protein [Verrucomicrobiae bacterium]
MNTPIIEIKHLKAGYGRRIAIDVAEFTVMRGEFIGLMGPNGAGKSTLLKILLGLQKKYDGDAKILGRNIDKLSKQELIHLRSCIGYVPQILPSRSQMPITAKEVISIGRAARAGLFKVLTKQDEELVDRWIEELGMTELAERPFSLLSGGEQRKVMIARAMVHEPELLLLDEPTANLDLGWREKIIETLDSLHAKTGITILLVAHEVEVIPKRCSKVFLLEHGTIVACGKIEDVFTKERIRDLYGVNGKTISHGNRFYVLPEC